MDSVTAVVSPLLGGQQREGECCDTAHGQRCDLPALESSLQPAQSLNLDALPICFFFSSRLGLDDAAGPRAKDPGPGPWPGSGGEEVGVASHACCTSDSLGFMWGAGRS